MSQARNDALEAFDKLKTSPDSITASNWQDSVASMGQELGDLSSYLIGQLDEFANTGTQAKLPASHANISRTFVNTSQWIIDNILSNKSVDARTLAMEFWIAVLKDRVEAGDFHTAQVINSAFTSSPIYRLQASKKGLSPQAQAILQQYDTYFSNLKPTQQFELFANSSNPNLIPYHGSFKTVIQALEDSKAVEKLDRAVGILQRMQNHHQNSNKGKVLTSLQQQLLSSPLKNKENEQMTASQALEPRDAQNPVSNLIKILGRYFVANDSQLKFDDGMQKLINENEKRKRKEEKMRVKQEKQENILAKLTAYANETPREGDSLDRDRKEELKIILANLKKDENKNVKNRMNYLREIIAGAPTRARSQTRLHEHHKGLIGIARRLRNTDTKAMRLLSDLYVATGDLDSYQRKMTSQRTVSAPPKVEEQQPRKNSANLSQEQMTNLHKARSTLSQPQPQHDWKDAQNNPLNEEYKIRIANMRANKQPEPSVWQKAKAQDDVKQAAPKIGEHRNMPAHNEEKEEATPKPVNQQIHVKNLTKFFENKIEGQRRQQTAAWKPRVPRK